eukprot:TRINITY_DN3312_c1_g5_i1.p1 TRINITY_DN3312_c1_g5~~TRINITY_DN3312_c1_g5_i1.p1  ORF type:complete len:65 (-),score=7.75 TRINITY_DN3312_c1_g5_i1:142-336(-)
MEEVNIEILVLITPKEISSILPSLLIATLKFHNELFNNYNTIQCSNCSFTFVKNSPTRHFLFFG